MLIWEDFLIPNFQDVDTHFTGGNRLHTEEEARERISFFSISSLLLIGGPSIFFRFPNFQGVGDPHFQRWDFGVLSTLRAEPRHGKGETVLAVQQLITSRSLGTKRRVKGERAVGKGVAVGQPVTKLSAIFRKGEGRGKINPAQS
jgi:hypothetical protein